MTEKEAIIRLELLCGDLDMEFGHTDIDLEPEDVKAIGIAIKTLKKQTPKKPLKINHHYECQCGVWLLFDDEILNVNDAYCPHCGQAIDWSEVE